MSIELAVVKWLRRIHNASTNVLHGGVEVRKKSSSFHETAEHERWRLLENVQKTMTIMNGNMVLVMEGSKPVGMTSMATSPRVLVGDYYIGRT